MRGRIAPVAVALASALLITTLVIVVEPRALDRPGTWTSALAGLGLGVWLVAHLHERRARRSYPLFTAAIGGLALSAAVLHNGKSAYEAVTGDFIRTWNVYHYYLGPKYFDEIGYYDLYRATLRADDEWQDSKRRAGPVPAIADYGAIEITRDMRTYAVVSRERAVADYVPRAAFSPERWQRFGEDTRWLRAHESGDQWARTLVDLGYNATPAWTAILRPLFNVIDLSSPWMRWVALSSFPVYGGLLLGMWWAFGARATLIAVLWLNVIAFNRDRFVGGILEYDWLASMVLGLALYAKGRPAGAGVAISWSVMTRGFPALLVVPIVVRWLWGLRARRPIRALEAYRRRFVLGLGVACAVLFLCSLTTERGLGAWSEWYDKIQTHHRYHPTNHTKRVGLGRLVLHHPTAEDFWAVEPGEADQSLDASHLRKRVLELAGTLLLGLALIGRRDEDAMILMLFGVFLFTTSSRYYASDWILLLVLATRPGQVRRRLPTPTPAVLAGACLLAMAAWFGAIGSDAGRYFFVGYQILTLFVVLCLWHAIPTLRRLLDRVSPRPE